MYMSKGKRAGQCNFRGVSLILHFLGPLLGTYVQYKHISGAEVNLRCQTSKAPPDGHIPSPIVNQTVEIEPFI